MADFNINDPSTFNVAKSDFKGNYTYRISVNPSDPTKYTGPPFFTVSSSQLLSESEILEQAQTIFDNRSRYQNQGLTAEFVIVEARAKPETFGV